MNVQIVPLSLLLPVKKNVGSKQCALHRAVSPGGIMCHFDDSSNDASSLEWFSDPTCHVSYNRLYDKDGSVNQITPTMEQCAYHAGVCRPSNNNLKYVYPNSFFYGLAISANEKETVTDAQFASLVKDCATIFIFHKWSISEIWRITGHAAEAWPRGRKCDPEGLPGHIVMSTQSVRDAVSKALT